MLVFFKQIMKYNTLLYSYGHVFKLDVNHFVIDKDESSHKPIRSTIPNNSQYPCSSLYETSMQSVHHGTVGFIQHYN